MPSMPKEQGLRLSHLSLIFAKLTSVLSSSVLMVFLNPVSASVSEISNFMMRSTPLRLNVACSFSSRTMMMSPGSRPGSWN